MYEGIIVWSIEWRKVNVSEMNRLRNTTGATRMDRVTNEESVKIERE